MALLAACSNSGYSGTIAPSGVTPNSQMRLAKSAVGPDAVVEFVYVTNADSNDVSAYSIKATSGALTPIKGSPFKAGTFPAGVAVDPTGEFAYVTNTSSSNVSAYSVNASSGALTSVKGSPFEAGDGPEGVAVDPNGKFVYVADFGYPSSPGVSAYTIDVTSGALTPVKGSPFRIGDFPWGVAIDPTGKYVYVTDAGSGSAGFVSGYSVKKTSGALTPVKGSPFAADPVPQEVTVDPTGKFAYVVDDSSGAVSAYTIDVTSGALTPVKGSPFAAGSEPEGVAVDPTGKFAYVSNAASNTVSAYSINATSGALTPIKGSPFAAGNDPTAIAIDPAGEFLYVTNFTNVSGYSINASSGALKKVKGSPFGTGKGPISIATCGVKGGKCIPPPL